MEKETHRKHTYYLKDAILYDGTGAPPFIGDVLIEDGKISFVGTIGNNYVPEDATIVDCHNLCVSPGFIDMHSHSDSGLPLYPDAECLIRQGITTTIGGNCGSSAAGIPFEDAKTWKRYLEAGLRKWHNLGEYLHMIDRLKPAVNIGMLIGHGDLRQKIAGETGDTLTEEQMQQMKVLVEQGMAQGGFGVSTGLEYVPGRFATVDELVHLSMGASASNGIHASHIRNEGPHLIESIEEILEVTRKSQVRFEVSHLKACGPKNWGKVSKVLDMFREAESKDINISCDFYPYLASSTGLSIVLPDWVLKDGKRAALNLLSGEERNKIAAQSHERTVEQGGWDKVVITYLQRKEDIYMEGLNVEEISQRTGLSPAQTAIEILVRNDLNVDIARHAMSEQDLLAVMKYPSSTVVTDGSVSIPEKGKLHPRSVGTFPRMLGSYVRDKGVLTMEEAIKKCTSLPAKKVGIANRGTIKAGYLGDIVIFDPLTIEDKSTYEDPWQYPTGIHWVFVNGIPVIQDGQVTGNRPGRALRNVLS
ncbi:MAG: D-aminoacylase [Bacillota bacterium]